MQQRFRNCNSTNSLSLSLTNLGEVGAVVHENDILSRDGGSRQSPRSVRDAPMSVAIQMSRLAVHVGFVQFDKSAVHVSLSVQMGCSGLSPTVNLQPERLVLGAWER